MSKGRRGTTTQILGRPGAGKSTLLHTLRGPRVILDAENGDDEFDGILDVRVVYYDEWVEAGRPKLGPRVSLVIPVRNYHDYRMGIRTLREDKRRMFKGFGIDSLTRVQELMSEELSPINTEVIQSRHTSYDHFRTMLDYMKSDLQWLHDQTAADERGLQFAFVCQIDRETTPMRPLLEGALRKRVLNIPDVAGFLRVEKEIDDNGESVETRYFDISSAEGSLAETKCRRRRVTKKWGDTIPNPNLSRIAAVASPQRKKTTK